MGTKPLPHSPETEAAVLAAAMLEERWADVLLERLEPEDFFVPQHQEIATAVLALFSEGTPLNLRTIQNQLENTGRLASAGGLAKLSTLAAELPDLTRVDALVAAVEDLSLRRRLIQLGQKLAAVNGFEKTGQPGRESLETAERAILELGERAHQGGLEMVAGPLARALRRIEEQPPGEVVGLKTGFPRLDRQTSGLGKGHLIVLAARPGMGKTSLAMNIAEHVAHPERGGVVAVFSLEMTDEELALRSLASQSDVSFEGLRTGNLSRPAWKHAIRTARDTQAAGLHVDDSSNPTVAEIGSKCRRLKAEAKRLDLVVVDYLQLMGSSSAGRHSNRNLEVGAITRGLKQLAKDLGCPLLCLSQLSREPERRSGNHRPRLADLRDSGSIEQDADVVAFVYRHEQYDQGDPDTKDLAEIIVEKNRHGGTGTVYMVWSGPTLRFRERVAESTPF